MDKLNNINSKTTLNNGVAMPWLGLGVFKAKDGQEVISAVKHALHAGYRSIDTAAIYRNEEGVGIGLKESGLSRKDVFVTTKLWNADQGYDSVFKAFEQSLKNLQTDYLDLYLIHWPVKGKYCESWKALEAIYKEGRVRAIGVSNFLKHHLEDVMEVAEIIPMVNQYEFHPKLMQPDLLAFCREQKIQVEAWAPIMRGKTDDMPVIKELALKYNKTQAQILLRWDVQHGVVTIPKSVNQERIIANSQFFDFELSNEDMLRLDALDEFHRLGPDPDNFDF